MLAAGPAAFPMAFLAMAVFGACLAVVVVIARHHGPGPADTAVAYERAWDHLDFATLWRLSSPRLRDGRSRASFVRDKQAAYAAERGLSSLVRAVRPEQVDVNGPVARVLTRLELADGHTVVDEMLLERIGTTWHVSAYTLANRTNGQ